MQADALAFGTADETNCDREQIHIPGSIQPHGCLLAFSPLDFVIRQAGGPTISMLGVAPVDLLGLAADRVLGPELTAELRRFIDIPQQSRRLMPPSLKLSDGAVPVSAIAHKSDGLIVLELEPAAAADGFPEDAFSTVQVLMAQLHQAASVDQLCQVMVRSIREISGFDRVMLYRFLQDGTGSVEVEQRASGMEPYLGLRYPASDIPAQARDLYVRNTLRLIPDATYRPLPIHADAGWPGGPTLDLSFSVLRSVSPIHLEYLANMGVVGSMSVSIVVGGKLWGLVACHHRSARFLPLRLRLALELFGQMASFHLETKLAAEEIASRLQSRTIQEALVKQLSAGDDITSGLQRCRQALLNFVPASGLALWIDGHFTTIGTTPSQAQVGQLVDWLNRSVRDGIYVTDRLGEIFAPAAAFADIGSGMLALSVSRSPRDYLIWFRPELVQVVHWAGEPTKSVSVHNGETRLSPRKSFAAWQQQVHGHSEPWSAIDIKTAEALRVSLLEIVLEHVDQLARERERARQRQEVLVAELDRRILQWEETAAQLKVASDRRAVLEAELSQVLRQTVIEQEAERQRIARELHDSLGQYLTAMKIDLDGIARDASASDPIRARVQKLKDLTADAGREVNNLAWEIRPTALDDLGLQSALHQFVEDWAQRFPLTFDVHLTLNDRRLATAIETALYRVLQEAIRNVVKHAEATRVGIILEATESEVRLIVEDNGRGFVLEDETRVTGPSSRLGLLGVRERLALVGGSLEIETAPGTGTTLLVHVPL